MTDAEWCEVIAEGTGIRPKAVAARSEEQLRALTEERAACGERHLMGLERRLQRLERQTNPCGVCLGCAFRHDDVRTIFLSERKPYPNGTYPPLCRLSNGETDPDLPDQPDRPRCRLCGGYMPPIAIVECWEKDAGGARGHEDDP
jgi:hypothetical protein